MTPDERFVEQAKKALAPLFNPEPHPFQEEWSDAHSMTSEQMIEKLAQALAEAVEAEREACAKVADIMPNGNNGENYIARAIRQRISKGEGV